MSSTETATSEWRTFFIVPIAAAVGYATSALHMYSLGPYLEPLQQSFGWSRAQVTFGLTITTLINALFSVPIGVLVDRVGSRTVGLIGVLTTSGGLALIGTATGGDLNWYLLWSLLALATVPAQATIWTSAVASRFEVSRGLALAVTLCGGSIGAAVFPLVAAWLIRSYGWRAALMAEGGIWAMFASPILFLFFRGARDGRRIESSKQAQPAPAFSGVSVRAGFRSSVFFRLLIANALFAFTLIALVVHFVPILQDRGADPMKAAGVASLVGLFSLVGRLGTGMLLDRYPASLVGAGAFLLPILASLLLLFWGENGVAQSVAAAVVGLTLGSEIDVIAYLAVRHFGLENFGILYGSLLTAGSLGSAFGPLIAAAIYDTNGDYELFLWLATLLMAVSAVALATVPSSMRGNCA
jgi:MFS family permease